MNNILENIKKYSLYIIAILSLMLVTTYCSKNKYKSLSHRYLMESTKNTVDFKKYMDSTLNVQTIKILTFEKEYDSSDSSLFNLKKRLNVSE